MWYKFTAYKAETRYDRAQNPAIADAALANLNNGKDVNLYPSINRASSLADIRAAQELAQPKVKP